MERLACAVQNYAWGKSAEESAVAALASADGLAVDATKPYAELWMGTHPSGPSRVKESGATLLEHLRAHPELFRPQVSQHFGNQVEGLPYLFKVLSVNKALSIQAHPDLELAKQLHARDPEHYKDPNHKPEMAIATTPFEAMCSFRPLVEIADHVEAVEALSTLAGPAGREFVAAVRGGAAADDTVGVAALRRLYAAMMTAADDTVQQCIQTLLAAVQGGTYPSLPSLPPAELVLRIHDQYPGDIGIFALFVLNIVTLQPGEAIFLGPNEPHAYLSGNCVECMACSDNVVRAGLTPKFKDCETLLNMLTYKPGKPSINHGESQCEGRVRAYVPPVDEFKVVRVDLSAGESATSQSSVGPSILLVYDGEVQCGEHVLTKGSVWYMADGSTAELAARSACQVFIASCNDAVLRSA